MKTDKIYTKPVFEARSLQPLHNSATSSIDYYQLDVFELIWVRSGAGVLTVDLEKRRFADNTLYCLFPGQIHRIEPERELDGCRIAFSEDFLRAGNGSWQLPALLGYSGEMARVTHLDKQASMEIEYIVGTMLWEYDNDNRLKADMLNGLLKLLIAHLTCRLGIEHQIREFNQVSQIYERFMANLSSRFARYKQVSDYAEELSVSTSYLSEVVKRISGYPAGYHIKQRVLLEAKRKAICEASSMKTIAYELGFDDPSTFSKFFKSSAGSSFSEFRKQYA